MKNFKSFIATGVLAASLFAMTGCTPAPSTPDVAPSASSSSPATKDAGESKPTESAATGTLAFKVDVDVVAAENVIPNPTTGVKMDDVFPADKFDRKEATLAALKFYDKLVNIQNFQQVRPAGSDKALIADFAGSEEYKVDQAFLDELNADIDAHGYLKSSLPTTNLQASLGVVNGVEYHAAGIPAKIEQPLMPQIYPVYDEKYGDLIQVAGSYDFIQLTQEGALGTAKYNYTVSVAPGVFNEKTQKQEWIVSGITVKNTGVFLTDPKTGAQL